VHLLIGQLAADGHATTRARGVVTAPGRTCATPPIGPAGPFRPLGQNIAASPWAKASPTLCVDFWYFIFFYNFRNSYKLLKYIENTIKLRKI
jgi:hypothetical protein